MPGWLVDVLMWNGWAETFLAWCVLSTSYAAVPFRDTRNKPLLFGTFIFLIEWVITNSMGDMFAQPEGVVTYAGVDVILGGAFLYIAMRYKAAWAAFCVLTHFGMGVIHFKMYVTEWHSFYYILSLNILYAISIAINNVGVWAGKHDRNRVLDRFVHSFSGGGTFSGILLPGGWRSDKGLG